MNWMRLKLQPVETAMRARQHRLADAGHVLDQHVAAAEQRDQREADLALLADDDVLDVGDDAFSDDFGVFHVHSRNAGAAALGVTASHRLCQNSIATMVAPAALPVPVTAT